MIRVLFVCHGNICRSPMAEFVMKDMVQKHHLEHEIYVESAATSSEEIGNPVYPPARRKLAQHGIVCNGKYARQLTMHDYDEFDYLIGMDYANIRNMKRLFNGDTKGKVHLLLSFAGSNAEVADPWYTDDFDATWRDVNSGCAKLLEHIMERLVTKR